MLGEGQGTQRCKGFRVSTGTIPLSKTEEQSEIERERARKDLGSKKQFSGLVERGGLRSGFWTS